MASLSLIQEFYSFDFLFANEQKTWHYWWAEDAEVSYSNICWRWFFFSFRSSSHGCKLGQKIQCLGWGIEWTFSHLWVKCNVAFLSNKYLDISALNPKLENEKIKCSQSIIMDLMSYYMSNVFIWMSSSLSLLYNDASCILMLVKGSNTVL